MSVTSKIKRWSLLWLHDGAIFLSHFITFAAHNSWLLMRIVLRCILSDAGKNSHLHFPLDFSLDTRVSNFSCFNRLSIFSLVQVTIFKLTFLFLLVFDLLMHDTSLVHLMRKKKKERKRKLVVHPSTQYPSLILNENVESESNTCIQIYT